MNEKFAPTTAAEYAHWVRLHLQEGGIITHFYDYDYPMHQREFLTALLPFALGAECGASSRHILVPEGIDWSPGIGMGHNTVHLADGSVKGDHVPVYADEVFHGLPGYEEGMAAARAARAKILERSARLHRSEPHSDLTRYAQDAPNPESAARTAPALSASVSVLGGKVRLIPSSMPLDMTSDEALALAEDLRAAALGASRQSGEPSA